MTAFNYNSFADLTQVFDNRKGQIVPPQTLVVAQPAFARVTLFSTTAIRQSKFIDAGAFLPAIKPLFVTLAAPKKAPVVVAAPAIAAPVVSIPANNNDITPAEVAAEEPKKARTTLRLKTKVELPVLQPLTRRSTVEDLAAAFRAERALLEKKAVAEPAMKLEDAFTKRRRHPLSDKPWSELLAEVETAKQAKVSPDIAALFKAEMKAFKATQERLGEISANTSQPTPRRQSLAA